MSTQFLSELTDSSNLKDISCELFERNGVKVSLNQESVLLYEILITKDEKIVFQQEIRSDDVRTSSRAAHLMAKAGWVGFRIIFEKLRGDDITLMLNKSRLSETEEKERECKWWQAAADAGAKILVPRLARRLVRSDKEILEAASAPSVSNLEMLD